MINNLAWSHNAGICLSVISFCPQTQVKAKAEVEFYLICSKT